MYSWHNAYICSPFVSLFHYSAISAFVIMPFVFVTSLVYLFLLSKTVLINTFKVFCGQEPSRQSFLRREDFSVRSPQPIVYYCNTRLTLPLTFRFRRSREHVESVLQIYICAYMCIYVYFASYNPAGTCRRGDVVLTSLRRRVSAWTGRFADSIM